MSALSSIRKHTRPIARWGCVAIGTVYLLVGVLALVALSGRFTGHADEDRMIRVILSWPGGSLIIWTIVAGLVGYAIWRALEVFADPYELTRNPEEVGDTDTAFDFIGGGVVGDTAFFFVALATAGYGVFMYLCAAFYRFQKNPGARSA